MERRERKMVGRRDGRRKKRRERQQRDLCGVTS
jgi:hypothetical protein